MTVRGLTAAALTAACITLPLDALAQELPAPPVGASAQVLSGSTLYQQHCALCHGTKGRNANVFPRPIWGPGHDIAKFGSAKGLFDYVQVLMPFDNPAKVDDTAKRRSSLTCWCAMAI